MPGDEDSRAGRRVTKTLTPGAGFRRKLAIPPQGAVTRVAAPPRGEWRCAHSPQRPASAAAAVTREHFAWRLADSAGGMCGGDDASAIRMLGECWDGKSLADEACCDYDGQVSLFDLKIYITARLCKIFHRPLFALTLFPFTRS